MSLIEEFKNLREYCKKNSKIQYKDIDLKNKVDEYLDWYYANMIKGRIENADEEKEKEALRNLIEKIAGWCETIYPSDVINEKDKAIKNIDKIIFEENPYIQDNFDENSDVHLLELDKLLNIKLLIETIPYEERYVLNKFYFPDIIYLESASKRLRRAHLHVREDGIVHDAEEIYSFTTLAVKDEELVGLHIKEVAKLFIERNIDLPEESEFVKYLDAYDRYVKTREGLLDAIMYRIIARGGSGIGPRRAFIFAKDFDRNMDIPMMYGADNSDPRLRLFINDCIKAGCNPEIECYKNYFIKHKPTDVVETVSLRELIATHGYTSTKLHTPEEDELITRLVTSLKPTPEEVEKEEIKQKRIERKIAKSKKKNSNN